MNDKDLQHLAAIVRDTDDAIMGKTLEGTITSWNGGAERIYGYTAEEAIGRTVAMLVPADRQDELPEILQKLNQGEGIHHYDTLRVTKDGRLVNISLTISPIRDTSGVIVGISSIGRDVTKEKEAEAALRESARAYKLLMEQASDAILVSYPDQPLIEINQRASDMLGYTREELLQLREGGGAMREVLSSLPLPPNEILEGEIVYSERPVRRKDGTVIVTELSSRRLDDGRIVTIAREVTDRKRAEQALKESEARYRAVVEDQTEQVSRFLLDGTLTFVNDATCRYWKRTRKELLGHSFFQFLPEDERKALETFLSTFNQDNYLSTIEQHIVYPDGTLGWSRWTVRALLNEQGSITEFQSVGVDITERKLAEKALQERDIQLSEAQKIAHIGSWVLDVSSGDLSWSDELYRIFGVEPQSHEASMEAYVVYVHPEDRGSIAKEIQRALVEEASFDYDHRVVRPDGSVRVVYTQGRAIADEGGKPYKVVGIVQDITEQRQAEAARTAKEVAEQANRAKSKFLSRMSHELRTPLNAILGFSQLLQMERITPEQEESVGYIVKAGQHLLHLITGVLDIARIEEGKLNISIEPVFARTVIQDSLNLVQPLAANRNIELTADVAWMDDCHVMADRQMLQQVLLNLLANAIKYNREGGVVNVSCRELSYQADEARRHENPQLPSAPSRIRIAVSDTGPGLSPDKVARLFTPFERLGAEQSDVEGSGLGLSLSRQLVDAMGGTIGVESNPGSGSTFWVELSMAVEHMPPVDLMVTGPLFDIHVEEQVLTMLYIEDNLANLRLLERILRKRPGIKLITAMQGQMGLDMAFEHRPDLILLDLHLPDMMGNEVLRRLRYHPRTASVPVVVLSADASLGQVEKLLKAGAHAYLTKPLDVEQLLKVLREAPARETG